MKLLKVHVPNFRNLKNVTLTFEPELTPQVFPISSENGGGKSTLLQLIFVFLNCNEKNAKDIYLENVLKAIDFTQKSNRSIVNILSMEILYENRVIDIDFSCIPSEFLDDSLLKILQYEKKIQDLWKYKESTISNIESNKISIEKIKNGDNDELFEFLPDIEGNVYIKQQELKSIERHLSSVLDRKRQLIQKDKLLYSYCLNINNTDILFVCRTSENNYDLSCKVLENCSKKLFLIAPPTQSYIFLEREKKKMLLSLSENYEQSLIDTSNKISGFYIYGKLVIEQILNAFEERKEKDWEEKLKTRKYGNFFQELIEDFHVFLGNDKYIFPNKELDSIIVRKKVDENTYIELDPEELSHGELKRLGLYAWIKYTVGNDAIVLIDEIENGLHPDWQYLIARELPEWGNNQYLLATHSFHLCEALTPRHVKEIEPKMTNPADNNNDN